MFKFLPWHLMFMLVIMLGVLVSISSSHWFGMWVGLEISVFGSMPLLVVGFNAESCSSAIKYFIIQSVGSAFILVGVIMSYYIFSSSSSLLVFLGLCVKLGLFPVYMWVPGVVGGLSWGGCFLVLGIQKVVPYVFLIDMFWDINETLVLIVGAITGFVGGVGGLGQLQVRAILAYSSMLHMGWMVCIGMVKSLAGYFCLFMYVMVVGMLLVCLKMNNFKLHLFFNKGVFAGMGVLCVGVCILSLGGMPPFSGFLVKLVGFSVLGGYSVVLFILATSSVVALSFYLSVIFSMCVSNYNYKMSLLKWSSLEYMCLFVNLLGPLFYMVFFSLFSM